ncbi:DUF2182 domain-containing protein [Mycolicibacterium sp. HK-90]|uniref:DUF2182 domain-containing protein n=1 Tax=Mycolicibacterium sp. HK-90 TaxID=3056937 RepID=UPI002659109B|nr:DUF2182 domain-containing protein [Mycolicibacterium sp. HK-90]WKG06301.1 DUF2182 domain-containing protein [Mycolicibacterium sp. HK-90]
MTTAGLRLPAWRRLWWTHPELSLLAAAALAWLVVLLLHTTMPSHGAAQHCSASTVADVPHHHGPAGPGTAVRCTTPAGAPRFPESLGLWLVMAAAMMLPTTLPVARSISLNGRWHRRHRNQALFAAGYLAVWSGLGVVALVFAWAAGPESGGAAAVSGALAVAASWELTRRKRFFLRACHRVRSLPADGWRADRAGTGEGVRNGLQCAGACGPMMVPMALAPHSLWLMVVLFGVVTAEKLVTKGVDHLRIFAAVLALVALAVAFGAPLA